jgi:hypothetical protein
MFKIKNMKKVFLLLAFLSCMTSVVVLTAWTPKPTHDYHVTAITNNGTKNSLPSSQLPSGYTRPTVTTFSDYKYTRVLTINVSKDSVQSATASTTMTNIFTHANVGINHQITAILTADFNGSSTVSAYADLIELTTNQKDVSGTSVALTNTAVSYVCKVILYIKTS